MNIKIQIAKKHATVVDTPVIVCGNRGYSVEFIFDSEWDAAAAKTARFVYLRKGAVQYKDVVFTGNTVSVPVLSNIKEVHVGVFAGDLRTTTPARIPCERSIRCGTGAPADPTPSQYDQIMELLQSGGVTGGGGVAASVEPAEDDIPKIFFGGALQQTKDEKVVPFRYISKTDDFSGYAEIKAQGNSSMNYAKKNQTVKMFKDEACESKMKVDFKGWGKQNKHVYKANWIDLSHSRNVVSARLWADVVKSRSNYEALPELLRTSPNQGAVDGFPVKVYAAGVYQGRYTLNIPKDKWTFNMDDELAEHCVLCGENYSSGCFRASANINESDWTDEIHDTVPSSIKTRWNQVISFVMNSTDDDFRANLGQYFFVDSLIDYYLFGLASCGLDAFGKNQIYATYDGQRWIASMYDMDSTWGLYWDGSKFVSASYGRDEFEDRVQGRQGNLLYMRLEQLFPSELKARWEELKNGALSIENIINRFERFTDIAPLDLVKEDYASTTGGGKFTGIPSKDSNNIQQIRSFALARQAWTDSYVAGLSVPDHTHSWDDGVVTIQPTETTEGERTYTCTGCGETKTETISTLDHQHSYTSNIIAPTCTEQGYTEHTCACGDNYKDTYVDATGHNYVNNVCTVCGAVRSVPCTGIALDKAELTFNGEGTQTLVATVTPSDTTDEIAWASSNPAVASITIENNICTVHSLTNGGATITVICGNYSTSCSVYVRGIAESGLLYYLPEETVFDGNSTFIDTGIKLFDTKKDFTIVCRGDFTEKQNTSYSATPLHCLHEAGAYPGLNIQTPVMNVGTYQFNGNDEKGGKYTADSNKMPSTSPSFVITASAGVITNIAYIQDGAPLFCEIQTNSYDAITETMILGAYQDTSGTKGRFWKGTLYEFKVYDYEMTTSQIEAYLNA